METLTTRMQYFKTILFHLQMDTATVVIFQICMHAERKTAYFKPVFSIIFYMDGERTDTGFRMEDYIAFVIWTASNKSSLSTSNFGWYDRCSKRKRRS